MCVCVKEQQHETEKTCEEEESEKEQKGVVAGQEREIECRERLLPDSVIFCRK